MGLFLQAGTARVAPEENVAGLTVDSRLDGRPHSAPTKGTDFKKQSSLACLKFMAQEGQCAISSATDHSIVKSRPLSAESRSGSVSPGTITGNFKIRGADGRPVEIIIGGRDGTQSKKGKKSSTVLDSLKALSESLSEREEDDEDQDTEEEKGCGEKACGCLGKILKLIGCLATCI